VHDRFAYWGRTLRQGLGRLNTAAGWLGTIVLILGIAGIVVSLVFNLSHGSSWLYCWVFSLWSWPKAATKPGAPSTKPTRP
jgi:hypothetical protein